MGIREFRSSALLAAFLPQVQTALEAEKADGKASTEIEYMFYARLDDVAVLNEADTIELQEQWGLWYDKSDETAGSGSIRVRKISKKALIGGELCSAKQPPQYVQTIKIKTKTGDALEVPSESSPDAFNAFKILADSGMVKHRYTFPIEGTDLKWEVDMFLVPGSDIHDPAYMPWCKVDLEVPNRSVEIPELPAGFVEMFDPKGDELTDSQQEVKAQMKEFLSLKNPHVDPKYKGL